MSWTDHAKSLLTRNYVKKAMICDHSGNLWGETENFLTTKDVVKLSNFFTKPNHSMSCELSNQSHVYVVKMIKDKSIYFVSDNNFGICLVKTKLAYFIGLYDTSSTAALCNYAIEYYAKKYMEMGY